MKPVSSRALLVWVSLLALVPACGPTFQRGSDDPSIDSAALSTSLDAADLEQALGEWYDTFLKSPRIQALPAEQRTIAMLQIGNDTSQYIAPQMQALIEAFETKVVNDGFFRVVTRDKIASSAILQEREKSFTDAVDPGTIAALGREFGVHYVVTGRISDNVEKTSSRKRVQYFLTLRVASVETSELVYQNQVQITKQVEG